MTHIDDKQIQAVQKVVGEVLYYARAVDITVLVSLSAITSEQSTTTEKNRSKSQETPLISSNKSISSHPIPCLLHDI